MIKGPDGKNGDACSDMSAYEALGVVELANLHQAIGRLLSTKLGVKEGALDAVSVDARKLSPDTYAALAWWNGSEKLPQPDFPSPGLKAAIRWLEAQNHPIGDMLAGALQDPGSSEMKLVLTLVKRGRGRPTNAARRAYEQVSLATVAEAEIAKAEANRGSRSVRDAATVLAAENGGRGRSTGYASRAALKRAKETRERIIGRICWTRLL
jgi:hypothetical protein